MLMAALSELGYVCRRHDIWRTLAWFDTKFRYRRTVIGPFWVTISTGLMVVSVGLVYGQIFGSRTDTGAAGYMVYFGIGTILWTFIAANLNEGCVIFSQSGGLIKALPVPLFLHVFRMMARNVVIIGHNAIIVVLLWIFLQWPLGWSALLFAAGFLLLVVFLFGAVLTAGVLCTRYRDLQQIVGALIQLMFLVTPILWPPSAVSGTRASLMLDLNPLYYMIEVVRAPLLGEMVELRVWLVALLLTIVSVTVGLSLYGRFKNRLAYWL